MGRGDRWRASAAVTIASVAVLMSSPAAAQSVADFYAGKSVNVLIGFTAGGGYDIYARTLARHMGRHIPGNPSSCRKTCRAPAACAPPTFLQRRPQGRHDNRPFRSGRVVRAAARPPLRRGRAIRGDQVHLARQRVEGGGRLRLHGLDRDQDLGRHAEQEPSLRPRAGAPKATSSPPCSRTCSISP